MDKVKKFFGRIWEWIKETAWFQVLCLVGLVIGIVLSISPITKAISNAIEDGKQVKYFEKHRITYDELNTKVEDLTSGKSEEDFGVIFYNYTKTENKDLQKGLNNYANDFSNIAKKVYALDINCLSDNKSAYNDDKYFETYKVNKQQLFHLGQAFQDVYTDEYVDVINNDEKEVKQDSKEYEISDKQYRLDILLFCRIKNNSIRIKQISCHIKKRPIFSSLDWSFLSMIYFFL